MPAGPDPVLPEGQSLVTLEGPGVVLSALKPAERGQGLVARVLNPTDAPAEATLRWGTPISDVVPVRLDEEPADPQAASTEILDGDAVRLAVPPHALRSVRVEPVGR